MAATTEGQQHPLGIYFKIWALLFVLSTASYMVDILGFESYTRWTLIITFMLAKAGLIVSVFMHMMWERPAMIYAITMPPLLLLATFIVLMTMDADYTWMTRIVFFGQ